MQPLVVSLFRFVPKSETRHGVVLRKPSNSIRRLIIGGVRYFAYYVIHIDNAYLLCEGLPLAATHINIKATLV